MTVYEELLDRDLSWALREGSMHFEKESAVHKTLRKITQRLFELGIPYALVGDMAMFFHGYRRFTEHVDILVTPQGLKEIHRRLEGRGYIPPFAGSKHLRDTEFGVKVEFLTTGDYPGDGKPKPVAFPDPVNASVLIDNVSCLTLPRLIELKLASGISNPGRLNDLGDVQRMIQVLDLPENLCEQMDPFVREKYKVIWNAATQNRPELN
jgi:hypothetical protein